jgi:membrane-bound metal-dependent hydrolase YbcI (DUF457 family)
MMGRTHAWSGVAGWLAATPLLDATAGLSAGQVALGAALCAGGAMTPDLDMHGSTIGRTYGPVTNVLARGINLVAGGHRQGTHSLVGVAAVAGLAWAAAVAGGWLLASIVWLLLGVAARALDLAVPGHRSLTAVIHALTIGLLTAIALAVVELDVGLVLPYAVLIGAAVHVAGDCLTDHGCPLLWPLSRRRYGVPVCTTKGWLEPLIRWGCIAGVVALVVT